MRDQALAVMCERPLNERDAGSGVASGSAKETEVRFAPDSPLEGDGLDHQRVDIDEETAHLAGNEAIAIRTDVTDPDSLQSAIRATVDKFPRWWPTASNAGPASPAARTWSSATIAASSRPRATPKSRSPSREQSCGRWARAPASPRSACGLEAHATPAEPSTPADTNGRSRD
jgi:hypothetical protein